MRLLRHFGFSMFSTKSVTICLLHSLVFGVRHKWLTRRWIRWELGPLHHRTAPRHHKRWPYPPVAGKSRTGPQKACRPARKRMHRGPMQSQMPDLGHRIDRRCWYPSSQWIRRIGRFLERSACSLASVAPVEEKVLRRALQLTCQSQMPWICADTCVLVHQLCTSDTGYCFTVTGETKGLRRLLLTSSPNLLLLYR